MQATRIIEADLGGESACGAPAAATGGRCTVLVADAATAVVEALARLLEGEGMSVVPARSPGSVLAQVQAGDYDAALIDLDYARDRTGIPEGGDLLAQLRVLDSTLPLVVLTAWGSLAAAAEAVRRGARDYVVKPWNNARLLTTLRAQLDLGRALRSARRLQEENTRLRRAPPGLVAFSPAMRNLRRTLLEVAARDENVLITGEAGCGKQVVARFLHAASRRAARPLVAVDAGRLTAGAFEAELFGRAGLAPQRDGAERLGAFEVADGGTLLLQQPGSLGSEDQALLLRALQAGEFNPVGSARVRHADVRVLSTSSAPLRDEAAAGRLREELLYRLNPVEVTVPPLRERLEDIVPLAEELLHRAGLRSAARGRRFSPEARDALVRHRWPGNVRELKLAVERARLVAAGEELEPSDLSLGRPASPEVLFERMTLVRAEQELIRRALQRWSGNVEAAARDLGLKRSTLYRRIHQHGLKRCWARGDGRARLP